jgi:predicted dehydrogenase
MHAHTDVPGNATPAQGSAMGVSRTVRVAVAGLGRAGIQHAALLAHVPGAELVGLLDPSPAARASARGMGLTAPAFAQLDRLVARARPDAVIVCAPEALRPEVARAALGAGLDVLVERPLASTLAGAGQVVAAAAAAGRRLAVAHPLVFDPVFVHATDLMAQRPLGPLTHASVSMFLSRVFGPRAGARTEAAGGVVAQVASDLLLLVHHMLGTPREVRATWTRLYGPVEDELHGTLVLDGGLEVGFDASWSTPGYLRSASVLELRGERGTLLASDDGIELELASAAGPLPAGATRVRAAELPHAARFDLGGEAPWLQLAAFVAWAAGGPPPPNAAPAAHTVNAVVDALYRSARAGGEPMAVAGGPANAATAGAAAR